MCKYKLLGIGLIFLTPIVSFSSPLYHLINEGANIARNITQSEKNKITNNDYNSNLITTNLNNQLLKFEDISHMSNTLVAHSNDNNNDFILKFNFPVDKFQDNLNKSKNYYFWVKQCNLLDNDSQTINDLESIIISYHLLTYLEENKNNLTKLDIDYLSSEQINDIKNNYFIEETENQVNHDCSDPDPSYQSQIIKNFTTKQFLEFERIESILSNRSLNVKYKNATSSDYNKNNFNIIEMQITPYSYTDLINSYIHVKYCSWEAKESFKIEKLLKDSSKTIIAFGEYLFQKKWQDRKAFNYVYTFQSVLKHNIVKDNPNVCKSARENLKNLNNLYRKTVV